MCRASSMQPLVSSLLLVLFLSSNLCAQEGTVSGRVVDDTGGVLPGVTVTATDTATGRQLVALTGDDGRYRFPAMPPSLYEVKAELQGFNTSVVTNLELLVGQNANLGFTLGIATLEESVTVTGDQPLIDLSSARVAGNIDRKMMETLPIPGRNWMALGLMVKGVTSNDNTKNNPGVSRESQYQLNLDGQQITQRFAGSGSFGNPLLSRESIAEYQIVTNLFDVTMGRSKGLQVQAISRSGSNTPHGGFYSYFRDDKFSSEDFVAKKVLPYSNRQTGFSLGGPILRDKLHAFGTYEYETEPTTISFQPSGYTQTLTREGGLTLNSTLVRVDYQANDLNHVMVRGSLGNTSEPYGQVTGDNYPSFASDRTRESILLSNNWTKLYSNNLAQEVKVGYFSHLNKPELPAEVGLTPTYNFPGLSIGTRQNYPQEFFERVWSFRYDLSWNKGTHDLKIGGEYLRIQEDACWRNNVRGTYDFSSRPSDMERRFPLDAWNNPSRWDFSGLDSTVVRYSHNVAEEGGQYKNCGNFSIQVPRPTYALWLGDTWRATDQLTLNYGLRYDLPWGDLKTPGVPQTDLIIDNGLFTENVGFRPDRIDANNVAPRAGFSWDVAGAADFVIRGGTGLFYADNGALFTLWQQQDNGIRVISNSWENDGLPGFIDDPTRGVTNDQILSGDVPLPRQIIKVVGHDMELPYTWQSTLGFQKRLNPVTAVDADLVYWKSYDEDVTRDANLFYDPVSGLYQHSRNRPAEDFGEIRVFESKGRSDYLALATSLTRRYRDRFQASATYTLMFFKNDNGLGGVLDGFGGLTQNPFDLDAEWARSADFQRHTFRANVISDLPYDIGVAAYFSLGSGNYFQSTSPVNPLGGTRGTVRILGDLTLLPRNDFKGDVLHKLDLRFSKDMLLPGGVTLSGIAEVFNVFNHANFGSYQGLISSSSYKQPTQNLATPYLPRLWQLGFRVAF